MALLDDFNAAQAELTTLKTQLAGVPALTAERDMLKATNATLTQELATAKAATAAAVQKGADDLAAARTAHTTALAAKDAEVETKAAAKAQTIIAAAGHVAPVVIKPADNPAAGSQANGRPDPKTLEKTGRERLEADFAKRPKW